MRIEYAEFPATGECYDSMGGPTGNCPTKDDYLAIAWGFLTVTGVAVIIGLIVRWIHRKRKKALFKQLDAILPLR